MFQSDILFNLFPQLFLEEERERDLEQLYESGLADTLNREDPPIGSGDPTSEAPAQAETTDVKKQTTETLMAGEQIGRASCRERV